jgi:hypothetical protein
VFREPVVLDVKEQNPIAVLFEAVVLLDKAFVPNAILLSPVVLAYKEQNPIAVLFEAVVLENKEQVPNAVLSSPP